LDWRNFLKIIGYIFFIVAMASYIKSLSSIFQLVQESRKVQPEAKISRLRWLPAWKIHRSYYPLSKLRRSIVFRFLSTFLLMIAAMACITYSQISSGTLSFP